MLTRIVVCLLQLLVRNDMYVIIDDHSQDSLPLADHPDLWLELWTQLLTDIIADPESQQRVLIDVLNEPDHAGLSWQTVGRTASGRGAQEQLYLN